MSAASWAGLLIAVVIAGAPSLAVPSLVALLVTAVLCRHGRGLLGWAAAVPAVLLLPWWIAVVHNPALLLGEPGGASASAGRPGAGAWSAVLWPADPATLQRGPVQRLAGFVAHLTTLGDATAWLRGVTIALAVPLLVLGLSALLRDGTRRAAAGLWVIGLCGLAVAVAAPVLDTRDDGLAQLHGWPGPGISLLTLVLLTAALARLDGAAVRLRARSLGVKHSLAVVTGIVAVIAPMLILAAWAVDGWSASPADWVHRGSPDVLPAVAAAEAEGPAATRTLVLKLTPHGVRWALYRAGGPRLGQDSASALALTSSTDLSPATLSTAGRPRPDPLLIDPVLAVIGGLLSGAGADQRPRLSDLDVGSVLLLAPADSAATTALDTAPGLVRTATSAGGVLWRVQLDGSGGGPTRPARVRVLSRTGKVLSTLPSSSIEVHARLGRGPTGRLLVLAERADPGWQAWLNGDRLTARSHAGWAQAFALPAAGGVVTVRHVTAEERPIDVTKLIIVGLALLVAVPLPRRRPRLLPPRRTPRGAAPPMPVETIGRRTRVHSQLPPSPAEFVGPNPEFHDPTPEFIDPDHEFLDTAPEFLDPDPLLVGGTFGPEAVAPEAADPELAPAAVVVLQPLLPPIWDVPVDAARKTT